MLLAIRLLLLCAGTFAKTIDYECELIPGNLKQIDAGSGKVYGVNSNDDVYWWVNNKWEQVNGKLIHVTVGPAGLWGVNRANIIFRFLTDVWKMVKGSLKQLDAGGPGFLVGVNANDNVYCLRRSCTMSGSSEDSFVGLAGSMKYYSCGSVGCWGVNKDNQIFYRSGVSSHSCQGSEWQKVEGSLVMVEVGSDNAVYGVDEAGKVYKREGITPNNRKGTTWTQLDLCGTYKHVTYDNLNLWALNEKGEIFKCKPFS